MSEEGTWVSITDAAAALAETGDAVDRSTLSRYLKQHAEALPLKRAGQSNLVELGALMAHRGENIRLRNPVHTGSALGRPPAPSRRFAGSQSDGIARKANADAEMKEMDLAHRRRHLTVTGEVDRAGREALALMQSAFDRAVESEAASLSVRYGWDERTVRLALKTFSKRGVEVFHREILQRLDAMRRVREADGDAVALDEAANGAGLQ
ncbi:hypothetical protein SAMN05216566_12533 [Aureimonas phyllosphaerae]|nr:hypothetical protein [Aureimonas phyllosphaerae]SFF54592.1 hypothetical protein SAMN05216566_12533 [Aureimonas phyllosphaerae]